MGHTTRLSKTEAFWCGRVSSQFSCTVLSFTGNFSSCLSCSVIESIFPLVCLKDPYHTALQCPISLQWKTASISAGVSTLFTGHLSALLAPRPLCLLIIKLWIAAAMGFFFLFFFFSLCTKCQIAEIKNVNDGV